LPAGPDPDTGIARGVIPSGLVRNSGVETVEIRAVLSDLFFEFKHP
jgi:hypothetical protein